MKKNLFILSLVVASLCITSCGDIAKEEVKTSKQEQVEEKEEKEATVQEEPEQIEEQTVEEKPEQIEEPIEVQTEETVDNLDEDMSIPGDRGKGGFQRISVPKGYKVWDGTSDTSWYTGDKDSYDIYTPEQLAGLSELVSTRSDDMRFENIQVNLMDDIYLNDIYYWIDWTETPPDNQWKPIGQIGSNGMGLCPFAGMFNGNGHTIYGMYTEGTNSVDHIGLFSYTSKATIIDLNISYSMILNSKYEDVAAGFVSGTTECSYFQNCNVSYSVLSSRRNIGGIVGSNKRTNVVGPVLQLALMGVGVVVNPAILNDGSTMKTGSYFDTCSVDNVILYTRGEWYSPCVGGILGEAILPTAIYGCRASNLSEYSVDTANKNNTDNKVGYLLGHIESNYEFYIKESTASNVKRIDGGKGFSDSDYIQ